MKRIGIIGFGRFGKLLASILENDFKLNIFDSNLYGEKFSSFEETVASDVVIFCVPILQLDKCAKEVSKIIRKDTIILDVCSVKLFPEEIFKKYFNMKNVLLTHPMFGPDSAKLGFKDLPIVICPTDETDNKITKYWIDYFSKKEFIVTEMSCDEHDRNTAYSLCMVQLLGRAMKRIDLRRSKIDTKGYETLLHVRDFSCNDSFELFKGLHTLNPYAKNMRKELLKSLIELEDIIS